MVMRFKSPVVTITAIRNKDFLKLLLKNHRGGDNNKGG